MRKLIFAFAFLISTFSLPAQSFEVPTLDDKPASQAEYDKMEPSILKCIDWLTATPLSIEPEKRISANAYFMLWLTGTSKVNVVVDGYVLNYAEKNPELMMAYMTGWSKLALEKMETDRFKLALAGMSNLVYRYKCNMSFFKKDKKLKKLLAVSEKGELESWLKDYFN
jgi:hypothetical protein